MASLQLLRASCGLGSQQSICRPSCLRNSLWPAQQRSASRSGDSAPKRGRLSRSHALTQHAPMPSTFAPTLCVPPLPHFPTGTRSLLHCMSRPMQDLAGFAGLALRPRAVANPLIFSPASTGSGGNGSVPGASGSQPLTVVVPPEMTTPAETYQKVCLLLKAYRSCYVPNSVLLNTYCPSAHCTVAKSAWPTCTAC